MRKLLLLPLAAGAHACLLQAQTHTNTYRVITLDGSPNPPTSIIIKGTVHSTTTNFGGTYFMQVPAGTGGARGFPLQIKAADRLRYRPYTPATGNITGPSLPLN